MKGDKVEIIDSTSDFCGQIVEITSIYVDNSGYKFNMKHNGTEFYLRESQFRTLPDNVIQLAPEQNRIKIDITLTIGDIGHVLTIKEAKQLKTALEALV